MNERIYGIDSIHENDNLTILLVFMVDWGRLDVM